MSTPQPVGAEVVDPVCGMTIAPEDAVGQVEHTGQTYYFCNDSCLDQFKADPERFLQPSSAPSTPARTDVEYTCPMHPEVRQWGPGSCPICGMPGWSTGTESGENASWRLVHFIRHLPQLTTDDLERIRTLTPRSPEEIRQQIEEEEFLKGGDPPSAPPSSSGHAHTGAHQ